MIKKVEPKEMQVVQTDHPFKAFMESGKIVTFYCMSYIYCGRITGINDDCLELSQAKIVYDVGAHKDQNWALAEDLADGWHLQRANIESYGILKGNK